MENKKITDLAELTAAARDDYLEIVDTSENTSKKISLENLSGGIGAWQDWTPTLTVSGGTAPTYTDTFVNRYCRVGKLVTAYGSWYNVSGGTAGAGASEILVTLPVAAATNALYVQIGTGGASLGAANSVIGVYLLDSTHVSFTTLDWGDVTGSDQSAARREISFTMMYEAA